MGLSNSVDVDVVVVVIKSILSDPADFVTEEYRRIWKGFMSSRLISLLRPLDHFTDEERLVSDDILCKLEWLSAGKV